MANVKSDYQAPIDTAKFWQALSSYAGRVAQSDDPKAHQSAAETLRKELKQVKR